MTLKRPAAREITRFILSLRHFSTNSFAIPRLCPQTMQTSRTKIKVYTLSMQLTGEENVITAIEVASGENVEITVAQKEKVAQGGWATVYRAEISPGKETIAIKQLKETTVYKVVSFERRVDKSIARWRFCGQ
jgi:hypothetical protein